MRPEGRQLQGEPLLLEELIKNTESKKVLASGGGARESVFLPSAPTGAPRLRPHRSLGAKERGPRPAGDRGVVLGG